MAKCFVLLIKLSICLVLTEATCPNKWTKFGQSCYWFSTTYVTWFQARDECIVLGGYLTEVEDKAESDFLTSHAAQLNKAYWLGGRRNSAGEWRWDYSKRKLSFTDWYVGEPNNQANSEDCLQIHLFINLYWNWNDITCDYRQRYVCETGLLNAGPQVPNFIG